jgi:fructokinase
MIIVIGEVLIDRFPEYERIGGAPFNFAFHLKQMGWPVRFITRIGDDADGRHILHQLAELNFDLEDIQIDARHPTGLVKIALDYQGIPQFDICKKVAYDHIDFSLVPSPNWAAVHMIYFGTLAQRTRNGFEQYQQFLAHKTPSTRGFCDINLRAPHLNREAIKSSLHQADILKLNSDELTRIGTIYQGPQPREALIEWVRHTFDIQLLALTQGASGSQAITAQESAYAAPKRVDHIVDTVGAGDAYAAILATGLLQGVPLTRTLELATDFAAHICTLPGALPVDMAPYQDLREKLGKDAP